MKKLLAICLVLVVPFVFMACGSLADSGPTYVEKHMHIGHEEIMNGDPQSIIEPLWWAVSIYDGEKKYNEDLSKFTLPQRYVFAIQWYVAEVNNGGHAQFFYNSTGIVYPDVLKGLEAIGHGEAYSLLEEVIAFAGGDIPLDRSRREKLFDRLDDSLHDAIFDLDMAFYDFTDLDDKIMAYIKVHETDFYFDGTVLVPEWPELDWDDVITYADLDWPTTNAN